MIYDPRGKKRAEALVSSCFLICSGQRVLKNADFV